MKSAFATSLIVAVCSARLPQECHDAFKFCRSKDWTLSICFGYMFSNEIDCTPIPDTPKPAAPKLEAPKPDTAKPDTAKPETAKPKAPKPTVLQKADVSAEPMESESESDSEEESEEPRVTFDDVFELNSDGQWQFRIPDVPELTFADIDQATIENWATEKDAVYRDMDARWAEAWESYQAAIEAPWNEFLSNAEDLFLERHHTNWQTNEEVFNFITANTYVDGKSIAEKFPKSVEWFAKVKEQADAKSEEFSLSQLRAPVKIQRKQTEAGLSFDAPRILRYHFQDGSHQDYDVVYVYGDGHMVGGYHDSAHMEAAMTSFAEKIGDTLNYYGYDQAEVDAYFSKVGKDWRALHNYQSIARANLAQAQIEESSLYIKSILNAALNDLGDHLDARNNHIKQDIESHVDEYYSQISYQSGLNFDAISAWMEELYSTVNSIDVTGGRTQADYEGQWGTRSGGQTVTTVTTETHTVQQPTNQRSATITITPGATSTSNISGNRQTVTTTTETVAVDPMAASGEWVSIDAADAGAWVDIDPAEASNTATWSVDASSSSSSSRTANASVSAVTLAKKANSKDNSFAYGFSIFAAAAAVVGGGFLYKQKKQKVQQQSDNLLAQDKESVIV